MKYTNNYGLPPFVVQWLMVDDYDHDPEVLSATRLLKPTRMIVLEKRHNDELEIDVTDVIASRYGTAIHDSFEKIALENAIQEHRFHCEVDGQKISGKPDILEMVSGHYILWDIKSTSAWTYLNGSRDEDHKKQLSIYRYIVMKASEGERTVDIDAKIIYIFTDWSRSKARQGGKYPPQRIAMKDVKLMTTEETEALIRGKLGHIDHFLDTPEPALPKCTRDELWPYPKDDEWAVMKEGRKSAVRKGFKTETEAQDYMIEYHVKNGYIEHRPSKLNRCNYCNVRPFCSQYKDLEEQGLIAE